MNRKEAIRQYKEQKIPQGAFAVRCTANGRVWVGSSRNLNAIRNRLWSSLRMGGYPDPALQQEWTAQGEQAFEYEILEVLDDDVLPMAVMDILKAKKQSWIKQLGAEDLL